ncbi:MULTISPECIES: carboxymuconolactone decarboxylase family protein [Streptomyces]|jgi:AhpD family alkylhydroperoxidase|uniref:Carboxymuconolactone decarboxylase family protein n=1 Tax=Streptomyces doudnae TaxID=3075536 RepID=A0ABD5EP14_9ACTN|nr:MULTISPECIES: carboxymuconolactone decarboxylase family protein [unclassified Streptomyces]MDT0436378.1 carboxymuconolactone decarboxylase family protein [Streptomyces sp. DSM 41981]MYQ62222.1 carboxymuconolactone decarboxylase family protein [Streptomyces sp. SID4950]SCD33048.1 alkylhydroperoxidase AhpD family core domain-containing protein [Streptomyces sp. SolWspMP-5a-2]
MCFHDPADRKYAANLRRATPTMQAAYAAFGEAVFKSEDAALPQKVRELIAVAVGTTTQCPFCIDSHTRAAVAAGATPEELAEAVMVSAAIRAGGGITHGFQVMKTQVEEARKAETANSA